MIKYPDGAVVSRGRAVGAANICTSIIVAGELHYGSELKRSIHLTERIELILGEMTILPVERGIERHYGRVRAALRRRGCPIGGNDMWIAAHALSLGATLVTDNTREFERVEGLVIENWLRD